MARFRFELEPVLRQRRREEEAQQRAVASLERDRVRLENAIRACRERMDAEQAGWRASAQGQVELVGLKRRASVKAAERAAAQRAAIELAGVLKRLTDARDLLMQATARRRGVELLKEQRFAAWRTAIDRAEALEMDDLTVMRHAVHGGDR